MGKDDDDGGSGSGGDGEGPGACVLCLRVTMAIITTILIGALSLLLVLLGFVISASTREEFTWISGLLIFVTVAMSISLLAQFVGLIAVVCMKRCLVGVYTCVQSLFVVWFLFALIIFIVLTVFVSDTDTDTVTTGDEVKNANLVVMSLAETVRREMNDQYEMGMGDINKTSYEQNLTCCGFVSPDEYWDAEKRIHDPTLKLADEDEDDRKEAMEDDPEKKPGGSEWHIKCLQDNNPGTTNKQLLDKPMCYAPKSCCKEDKNGCNDAKITLRNLDVKEEELENFNHHKFRWRLTSRWPLWNRLRAYQTGKKNLVTPAHKEQMFDESCMKKYREGVFKWALGITVCIGCIFLLWIGGLVIMCCLQKSMKG